ncbi:uncharacterized protein LOC119595301 isoform X3 [Penaeus monodon]|uniref:uncharacterized protein LOC119595301 isoform X3 n=1 Tax=Penaeus monodon TaxID=6687 RepID=UPI0018A7CA36|nr:uncharacterized protein LOC119595301 isoform X3 [Penaeus monodon]
MSMNVGDSTDLINGGLICRGGGFTVFWRSRTGFERKLLLVLTVLTLAVIGLVVAVAVLASEEAKCRSFYGDVFTSEQRTLPVKISSLGSSSDQDFLDSSELPDITAASVKSVVKDVRWR